MKQEINNTLSGLTMWDAQMIMRKHQLVLHQFKFGWGFKCNTFEK